MQFSTLLLTALSGLGLVSATSRTSAPSGALVVGSGQTYTKVQDAVDALSTTSTTAQSIFIEAGTYKEQVYIPARKAALTIYGYTTDTSSYSNNKVTITYNGNYDSTPSDDETATVRAWTENLKIYNVNIVNSYGSGAQAVAISASATNQGYYGCQFSGYQDTVMSQTGYQIFAKSLIEGNTDFIFGQNAATWFDQVDLRVPASSLGYVTAQGRTTSSGIGYFVINNSTIAAQSGATVSDGVFYLGRPWKAYARVVFQETSMTSVINSAGWAEWSSSTPNTADATFEEYDNTGDGASGTRASFSKKISSPIAITAVLGSSYASASYVDSSYLS